MNEVYFIGGPFDLTKRILDKVDGNTIRMYDRPPYSESSGDVNIEYRVFEYRLHQIQYAPNGNRRFIALLP
jgi:hypothetical protein